MGLREGKVRWPPCPPKSWSCQQLNLIHSILKIRYTLCPLNDHMWDIVWPYHQELIIYIIIIMYLKECLSTIEYEGIFIIIKPFSEQGNIWGNSWWYFDKLVQKLYFMSYRQFWYYFYVGNYTILTWLTFS